MTEPAPAPVAEQPPAAPASAPPDEQRVPYDRFKQVNDERQALATQVQALEAWKREQEQAQLSELERAQTAAQEATTRAEQAEQRAVRLERSQFVRQAAAAAGFTDPDDAVAFLGDRLADFDDADKAAAAVTELAGQKKHLLSVAESPRPAGLGSLTGGHAAAPSAPPVGADGQPDVKAGLGQELMAGLFGKR